MVNFFSWFDKTRPEKGRRGQRATRTDKVLQAAERRLQKKADLGLVEARDRPVTPVCACLKGQLQEQMEK